MDLAAATSSDFEERVGDEFRFAGDAGGTLVLTQVEDRGGGLSRVQFSLLFTGEEGARLGQGSLALEHDDLGSLEIFLVPLAPGPDGRPRYEAAFA